MPYDRVKGCMDWCQTNRCMHVCNRPFCGSSILLAWMCAGLSESKYVVIIILCTIITECGSTLYVGMAQGVSFSLYIGIGAKFENTQKTGERRLSTAEYRTVLL